METGSKASKLQAEGWAGVIRLQNGFPWVSHGAKWWGDPFSSRGQSEPSAPCSLH